LPSLILKDAAKKATEAVGWDLEINIIPGEPSSVPLLKGG